MRSCVAIVGLVWVASMLGCDSSHEVVSSDSAGVDAALSPDVGDGLVRDSGVDPRDVIGLEASGITFTTCNCHHGCAPGIDGSFVLSVVNHSDASFALTVSEVSVVPMGTPAGPFVTGTNGYLRVEPSSADGSFPVPPRSHLTATVTVYLDIPVVQPGTANVEVAVTVDGTPMMLGLSLAIDMIGGC